MPFAHTKRKKGIQKGSVQMLKPLSEKRNQFSLLNQYLGYLSLVERLGCSDFNSILSLEDFKASLLPTLSSEETNWLETKQRLQTTY